MLIDLHVHTDRHSGCSHMSPEAMAQTALDRGLDGVVITEHDYLWSWDEVRTLQRQFPKLKILRGIEVSTAEGHALVYGISQVEVDTFTWHMSLIELSEIAHHAGGIVILAHPTRYEDEIPDPVYRANLDGVEAYSMNVRRYMSSAIDDLQSELAVPGIAGTDAHATESLGYYASDFGGPINSESELVASIKARAFRVYADEARIAAYNAGVGGQVAQMEELIEAGSLSDAEIKARYGLSYSFQKGVRRGKDMHLRPGPRRTEARTGAGLVERSADRLRA